MGGLIRGADPFRRLDLVLVNSPLRDYDRLPDSGQAFTLPVLGLAHIATACKAQGFNVGVLDAEDSQAGLATVTRTLRQAAPRWLGLNLLAPTFRNAMQLARNRPAESRLMLGGPMARAATRFIGEYLEQVDAYIPGEADLLVPELLRGTAPHQLPGVGTVRGGLYHAPRPGGDLSLLAPNLDSLPVIERSFLGADPYISWDGRLESALVGSRGCPYDCGFCSAARSMNDVGVRARSPGNLVSEMRVLHQLHGVTAFRFVDDLFLASPPRIRAFLDAMSRAPTDWRWDATGRVNVASRADESLLVGMKQSGCREVSLGIETGSNYVLELMRKQTTVREGRLAVQRLLEVGINVKGYFILGYPGERDIDQLRTLDLITELWAYSDNTPGSFRCSAFEFRPYPGTPVWQSLVADGYDPKALRDYSYVQLPGGDLLKEREEFSFAVGMQFSEVPLPTLRHRLARLMAAQTVWDRQHRPRTRSRRSGG